MKIWSLLADVEKYNSFNLVNQDQLPGLVNVTSFSGIEMKYRWDHHPVEIVEEKEAGDLQSFFGGVFAFNTRAIESLDSFLQGNVEYLPLEYSKGEYYLINVLNLLNGIDYNKSIITRFNDGSIMRFEKYAFSLDKVKGEHIFKIIDEPRKAPFVSDEFRNKVIQEGLTGFLFTEVWDSETE